MERCAVESEWILFKVCQRGRGVEKGKGKNKRHIFDRIIAITHLASVPGRVLSGIVRLGLRPGRTVSQHAGGRRFA